MPLHSSAGFVSPDWPGHPRPGGMRLIVTSDNSTPCLPEGPSINSRNYVGVRSPGNGCKEVEQEDNEYPSFHSDSGTKAGTRRAADSYIAFVATVAAQAISGQKTSSWPLEALKSVVDAARSSLI